MAGAVSLGAAHGLSVVIPAHDEGRVIARSLTALLSQRSAGGLDVVVVANGCGDDTVDVASSFIAEFRREGMSLRIFDIPAPSKVAALNFGDCVKRFAATLYLDADVVVSPNTAAAVRAAFNVTDAPFVAPRLEVAEAASSISRAYGRVWSSLPYIATGVRGVGCYAVNDSGRARWDRFPEILADDRFARLHFTDAEARLLEDCSYRWPLPEGWGELVRVRARWMLGNNELARRCPELLGVRRGRYRHLGRLLWHDARSLPDLSVFLAVYTASYILMLVKRVKGDRTWERADRSRRAHEAGLVVPPAGPALHDIPLRPGP